MSKISFEISLPTWVDGFLAERPKLFSSETDRMALAIDLSAENVKQNTGGPFGAAVFNEKGTLIAVGVNLVSPLNCSVLHAEIVAFMFAQQALGRFDISNNNTEHFELSASTEPCAMCFGATPWSGVKRLVCGARDEDARAIGFDEGPKLDNWQAALESRGISVATDVLREEARAVLNNYLASSGVIYNGSEAE